MDYKEFGGNERTLEVSTMRALLEPFYHRLSSFDCQV